MQKSTLLRSGFAAAASISMLVACGPNPNPTPTPRPSTSASATPSASPSATPSATPTDSPSPSATPSDSPSPSATPSASASASATPSGSATPTPLPTATSDISVVERTTFNGKVFDDTEAPLDGVKISAKSLNASVPYEEETTTAGGTYSFNNAPAGVQIEITATKSGFTTRRRVEVLKSNKQGDPNANKYDFGAGAGATSGTINNALSDLPEVTAVTPGRNSSGIDPKTSFVLKFSEPMDRKTVEDTFAVRSHNDRKLTVDNGSASPNTVTGDSNIATRGIGTKIWDKDAFNITWNSDDTEATFSFKEERLMPTDKDSNLVPDYTVSLENFTGDRVIKDKSGLSRNDNHFKLTEGPFEQSYKFSIRTDEVKPDLSSVSAQTDENGGTNGDAINVRYSERMIIYARDLAIAGGMNNVSGSEQQAPAAYPLAGAIANGNGAAKNYNVRVIQGGGATTFAGTWGAIGGTAVYDTNDVTHKTVLLLPPTSLGVTTVAGNVSGTSVTAVHTFTDGSTFQAASANIANNSYAAVTAAIQSLYDSGTVTVTETRVGANAGTVEAADQFTVTVSSPATANAGKTIVSTHILNTGAFASAALNGPAQAYVFPGAQPSQRLDLYEPGNTVRVEIASTVLDPAGNTLNTSRDDASANAS